LGCTKHELLQRISSEELTEWVAYFRVKNQDIEKAQKDMQRKAARSKG
jgi:hypothetical protein